MKAGWVMKNGCGGDGGGRGKGVWGRCWGRGRERGKWVFAFDRDPKLKSEDQEAGWERSAGRGNKHHL